MNVDETYGAKPLAASAPLFGVNGGRMGGFLCVASGTIKLTVGSDGLGATIVDTVAVTAGVFLPMPFVFSSAVYATLAGGAAGTFAIV